MINSEDFSKIYERLPKPLQEALYSDEIISIIKSAGLLAKLNDEELFALNETVTDVLLGQITPENFSIELGGRLKISEASLKIIDRIIQDKIFRPLHEDLEKCKHLLTPQYQPLGQKILQETEIKEQIEPLESSKIKPVTKGEPEQVITEQKPSEPIIPEYSFPEPSEVKVEKPVSKVEELKKVVAPKISSEQQEKIREKLLAAMQKKDTKPRIVEEMKKVFLKPQTHKQTKEEEKVSKKKEIGELTPSKILSGEGKKFKDEESFVKTEKEKPYILDAKLKEEKEEKKETPIMQEPIPYKKYQKRSPFGEA